MTKSNSKVYAYKNKKNKKNNMDNKNVSTTQIPTTMKAVVNTHFGENIDSVLKLSSDHPCPVLPTKNTGEMLIRVYACSISPGDYRNTNGSVSLLRTPDSFPWVPGHEVCGVVVALPSSKDTNTDDCDFSIGDCIVVGSSRVFPYGGLAEYALVEMAHAALKPSSISPELACCLPTSAQRALQAVRNMEEFCGVKNTDSSRSKKKVLVLGGSGGFGSFVLQFLKRSHLDVHVVTTSTQEKFCKKLGADRVIDYTKEDIWTMEEYVKDNFDCIMDCAPDRKGKLPPWKLCKNILKPANKHGLFLALAIDDPNMKMRNIKELISNMGPVLMRAIVTTGFGLWYSRTKPAYRLFTDEPTRKDLAKVLDLIANNDIEVVFDTGSPFSFTEKDVKEAFHRIGSKHAHGKVCVTISKP